ncbi:MAG: NAD-dependent epimerase/dehydratase family protein [Planctomycetaceae bacterium]|jgi:dTDP-6-deoxy-L-talose 4-dehydrogenase (NAD+)|nr:NAD-dependent epimerase/dehydratase family protein [Planctomycetaceae bacterium]
MKILITGATGFIGRYVVRVLAKTEHEIIATSTQKTPQNFENINRLKYISADLNNQEATNWYELFCQPDLVIHLAWQGLPNYGELFHIERNLWTSYCFLKQMIESGTRDITVIGTCFEYGLQEGCLSEDLPAKPNTIYGVSKNTLRIFLEQLQTKISFDFKWIRLFYLYGQGQNKNSILEQLKSAIKRNDKIFNMSGGEQLRDYLPVEVVAENIVKIALQNKIQGIINNCSGQPISIRRLVEEYLQKTETKIDLNLGYYPYPNYEPHAFWGCTKKITEL